MPELYKNADGTEYAVLVSGGYGAGWSTWGDEELAYDKRVVEFFLQHENDDEFMRTVEDYFGVLSDAESDAHKEAARFFRSIGYKECPYMGGFSQIHIEWVPYGSYWRINEYDGSESLEYLENAGFTCFIQ